MELWFKPLPKKCYYNAQRIAMSLAYSRYVEGTARDSKGNEVPHAWNMVNGRLLDITPGTSGWTAYNGKSVYPSILSAFVQNHGLGMSMIDKKIQHTSPW
jgi:hypothetical protein